MRRIQPVSRRTTSIISDLQPCCHWGVIRKSKAGDNFRSDRALEATRLSRCVDPVKTSEDPSALPCEIHISGIMPVCLAIIPAKFE